MFRSKSKRSKTSVKSADVPSETRKMPAIFKHSFSFTQVKKSIVQKNIEESPRSRKQEHSHGSETVIKGINHPYKNWSSTDLQSPRHRHSAGDAVIRRKEQQLVGRTDSTASISSQNKALPTKGLSDANVDYKELQPKDSQHIDIHWEEENCDRLYSTKRDTKRIITLKKLGILPTTPSVKTFAEVGQQVEIPIENKEQTLQIENLNKRVKELKDAIEKEQSESKDLRLSIQQSESTIEKMIEQNRKLLQDQMEKDTSHRDLNKKLTSLSKGVEELKIEINTKEKEINVLNQELEEKRTALQSSEKDNIRLENEIQALKEYCEKLQMEISFLTEEKEDLDKNAREDREAINKLRKENDRVTGDCALYKDLFLQTKLKSSQLLGHYLDELNDAIQDKRRLMNKKGKDEKKWTQMMVKSTDYLKLKEEKHRLVEQVEYLSSRTVSLEMHVDQLQEAVSEMAKLLYAYENTGVEPLFVGDSIVMTTHKTDKTYNRKQDRKDRKSSQVRGVDSDSNLHTQTLSDSLFQKYGIVSPMSTQRRILKHTPRTELAQGPVEGLTFLKPPAPSPPLLTHPLRVTEQNDSGSSEDTAIPEGVQAPQKNSLQHSQELHPRNQFAISKSQFEQLLESRRRGAKGLAESNYKKKEKCVTFDDSDQNSNQN